jgi:hypothetical protein
MPAPDKFCFASVKLTPLTPAPDGELCDRVFRKCFFCDKDCLVQSITRRYSDRLGGPGRHFCPFCLRKGMHTKNRHNILVLSFRSIIGHFYYQNYLLTNAGRKMFLADIDDYIESHIKVGMLNPVFDYDPETFLWFVDFARVGQSKRRLPVEEVNHTVMDILACFNLSENVPGLKLAEFFDKYKTAIQNFYERRYRPDDKRMLIPTLVGCLPGANTADKSHERTRSFTANEMCGKK